MSVNKANGGTDKGFLNHTLAYFDTQDFQNGTAPLSSAFGNVEICRYSEYRNPPWVDPPYKRPLEYWHIMAARLAFIVVFQVRFFKYFFYDSLHNSHFIIEFSQLYSDDSSLGYTRYTTQITR